jgi:putative ATP-dependent endonuclease of OLD family
LHELDANRFKTLEALGIAVINANTDSQIVPLGEFFVKLGKMTLAVFDKQSAGQKAAIDAKITYTFEAPEVTFEDAVLNGTAESALRRYGVGLVNDGVWPRHLAEKIPTEAMPIGEVRAALREYLMWSKGAGGAADLLAACSLEEMPDFIVKIIEGMRTALEAPAKPATETVAQNDEAATESLEPAAK